jgi:hypothetical protein
MGIINGRETQRVVDLCNVLERFAYHLLVTHNSRLRMVASTELTPSLINPPFPLLTRKSSPTTIDNLRDILTLLTYARLGGQLSRSCFHRSLNIQNPVIHLVGITGFCDISGHVTSSCPSGAKEESGFGSVAECYVAPTGGLVKRNRTITHA